MFVDSFPNEPKRKIRCSSHIIEATTADGIDNSVEIIEKSFELLELPAASKEDSVKRNLSDTFSSEIYPIETNTVPSFADVLKQQNKSSNIQTQPSPKTIALKPVLKRDLSFVLDNLPAFGRNSSTPKKSESETLISLSKENTPNIANNKGGVKKVAGSITRATKRPLQAISKIMSETPSKQKVGTYLQVCGATCSSPAAIIKSIRKKKRSMSADESAAVCEKKNVTFHSPANMEMSLYEIDIKILSEVKSNFWETFELV